MYCSIKHKFILLKGKFNYTTVAYDPGVEWIETKIPIQPSNNIWKGIKPPPNCQSSAFTVPFLLLDDGAADAAAVVAAFFLRLSFFAFLFHTLLNSHLLWRDSPSRLFRSYLKWCLCSVCYISNGKRKLYCASARVLYLPVCLAATTYNIFFFHLIRNNTRHRHTPKKNAQHNEENIITATLAFSAFQRSTIIW